MGNVKRQVILYSLIFIAILVIFLYFFGAFKKTCYVKECFEDFLSECSPVKYKRTIKNNIYVYDIKRSLGNDCNFKISLERSAEGTDFDTRYKLEGKSMSCIIPKNELFAADVDQVENLLQYCTGPLKEGIYEIIIKNMYGVIISNLGEVLTEVQTSVIKKI